MTNIAAFGSYVPGHSAVHQTNAQVKIILACVFSIAVLFVGEWLAILLLLCATLLLYARSGVPVHKAAAGLCGVAFILVFTVFSQTICIGFDGGFSCWLSLDGFYRGLFFASRIALIIMVCGLLTFTTAPLELVAGLQKLLCPLRRLKLPVDDICMVVSMTLRFVPTITQEAYGVRRAQLARGAAFGSGTPWRRIAAWGAVLIPLFVRLFKRAEVLGQAMDARCYAGQRRGSLHEAVFTPVDGVVLLAGILLACSLAYFF